MGRKVGRKWGCVDEAVLVEVFVVVVVLLKVVVSLKIIRLL